MSPSFTALNIINANVTTDVARRRFAMMSHKGQNFF